MAKHVDYYVSLNSPWTYLGSKRFEAISRKHGADITMRLVYRDQTLWDKVEPGQQVSGTMVFDIPLGLRAESLELHDSFASGGVTVRLR